MRLAVWKVKRVVRCAEHFRQNNLLTKEEFKAFGTQFWIMRAQ